MPRYETFCVFLMLLSAFLAAFSQILLKKSALETHRSFLFNYLNIKVLSAYCILGLTIFFNIYALTGIPFKYASVLNASSYIFAMILSALLLKDRLSWQCILGNCLIVVGIAVYASNWF